MTLYIYVHQLPCIMTTYLQTLIYLLLFKDKCRQYSILLIKSLKFNSTLRLSNNEVIDSIFNHYLTGIQAAFFEGHTGGFPCKPVAEVAQPCRRPWCER